MFLGGEESKNIEKESLQQLIIRTTEASKDKTGMVLNIALNYGGRAEIVDAAKKMINDNEEVAKKIPGFLQFVEIEPFLRQHISDDCFLHLSPSQLSEIKAEFHEHGISHVTIEMESPLENCQEVNCQIKQHHHSCCHHHH